MTTALTKTLRRRSAKKRTINENLNEEINKILSTDASNTVLSEANVLLESLIQTHEEVRKYDEVVEDLIDTEEDLDRDVLDAHKFHIEVKKTEEKLKEFIKRHSKDEEQHSSQVYRENTSMSTETTEEQESSIRSRNKFRVKLPVITIKPFDGQPINWNSFIDQFNATIDVQVDLTEIEKLTYLKGFLVGDALQTIEGLPLTNQNYTNAKDLLKARYGNPQLIISSHMNNLIQLEKIVSADVRKLRGLYDKIEANVRALNSVGIESEHFGALLIPIILQKLPNVIKLQVSRQLGTENWGINEFLNCLSKEISARESYELLKCDDEENEFEKGRKEYEHRRNNSVSSLHISHHNKICLFCEKGSHYSDKCDVVTEVDARREKLKKDNHCFRCLKKGHISKDCTKKIYCYRCKMQNNHNTALCTKELKDKRDKSSLLTTSGEHVLLQTAQGYITDEKEITEEPVKILLDSCSQQSYINEKVARKLRLKPIRSVNTKIKTFGNETGREMLLQEFSFAIKPMDKKGSIYCKALAVPKICEAISDQHIRLALNKHEFLRNLRLADYGDKPDKEIDLLIGADIYWKIVNGNVRIDPGSGLAVINSSLGWLVNGPVMDESKQSSVNVINSHVMKIECERTEEKLLSDQISRFWSLDAVGIVENESSVYEKFTEKINLKNGRYTVELPFKESHPGMPDNFTLCKKRLESLKKRLDSDDELKRSYNEVFQDQLKCGVIEKVEDPGIAGETTYLPHREVVKAGRSSTKVRIVFDGSAKRINSVSLNEILYKGPSLTPNLYDLLLKFRLYPIAITADIEKAYLQINVHEKHRDYLRFLWYKNVFDDKPEIEKYRFRRVIFGATSSQFLLNSTIHKHAEKYESIDPEFARKARKHFYVDDLTTGVGNVEEGIELYKKFKLRFMEANFNIRKWKTNSKDLEREIQNTENYHIPFNHENSVQEIACMEPVGKRNRADDHVHKDSIHVGKRHGQDDRVSKYSKIESNLERKTETRQKMNSQANVRHEHEHEIVEKEKSFEKILGIEWDNKEDILRLGVGEIFRDADGISPTKRNILKIIASVYDPIGILQPIMIKLKLLFQEICLLGVAWDEKTTSPLEEKWKSIVKTLKSYADLYVDRCYTRQELHDPIEKRVLHGFSDASEKAYGACVYLKTVTRSGIINVSLVTAKSRVAPVKKKYTIPRLELLGNFVLARLIQEVQRILNEEVKIDEIQCWSDSMITLSWIKATDQEFETFVQNRVVFIREKVHSDLWKYVATHENPADLVTRFESIDSSRNESNNSLWLKGPEFLKKKDLEVKEINFATEDTHEKRNHFMQRKETTMMATTSNKIEQPVDSGIHQIVDINTTNNYLYLMKITAWVLRFLENCRVSPQQRNTNEHLTSKEITEAERCWIKSNQQKLRMNQNYNNLVNSLNLKEDEKGIIRSRGRIAHANVPYDTKEPIMLDRNHKLTEMIIWHCHDIVKHEGLRETLAEIQSRFWITQSKGLVKRILFRCRICRQLNSRSFSYPKTPSLPKARLKDDTAFSATGVDHMGPLYTKNVFDYDSVEEDEMFKCYITLYTCASTRGIILDLVPDTSSRQFIYSIRRFIARRGCPNEILSDNGSAFTAEETQIFAAERRIIWHFSVAEAPWFGGFWERLVQLTKRCLKKVVGRARLTYVEMQTILLEIELVLNSRPLCELYDNDFEEPLTPNHLLFGRKLPQFSTDEEISKKQAPGRKRARYVETLTDHFWQRWRKEYCVSLRNFQRAYRKKNDLIPKEDDVVIIYENKVPRQNWRLGKIISLIPSKDGHIRAAKVLVGKTRRMIERPINKLYPIEFSEENTIKEVASTEKNVIQQDEYANNDAMFQHNPRKSKRAAAIMADVKRKYMQN